MLPANQWPADNNTQNQRGQNVTAQFWRKVSRYKLPEAIKLWWIPTLLVSLPRRSFLSGEIKIYQSLSKTLNKNVKGGYASVELEPVPREETERFYVGPLCSGAYQGLPYDGLHSAICILSRKNSRGNIYCRVSRTTKNIPVFVRLPANCTQPGGK